MNLPAASRGDIIMELLIFSPLAAGIPPFLVLLLTDCPPFGGLKLINAWKSENTQKLPICFLSG